MVKDGKSKLTVAWMSAFFRETRKPKIRKYLPHVLKHPVLVGV